MTNRIKIVIADDHPVFREGLRQVIESDAQMHLVGEAVDGQEAIARILETNAEVAVVDVDMPNGDGFEVVRTVKQKQLPVKIVFLTMHNDERFLNAALDIGVKGYLLKDSAVTEIIASIKAVAANQDYVSPVLTGYLLKRGRRAHNWLRSNRRFTSSHPLSAECSLCLPIIRRARKLPASYSSAFALWNGTGQISVKS
jgi:DNA-binding NarL/FixJ family response regulator